MPARYGERRTNANPASQPPPMAPASAGFAAVGACGAAASSRWAQTTASSSRSAATISRFTGPSGTASSTVTAGPSSAPADPPAAMKPNRRLPDSLVHTSAMKDQNTETANRLNTLIQTKNTRATWIFATSKVSSSQKTAMLRTKK